MGSSRIVIMEWNGMEWNGMEWNVIYIGDIYHSISSSFSSPKLDNSLRSLPSLAKTMFRLSQSLASLISFVTPKTNFGRDGFH